MTQLEDKIDDQKAYERRDTLIISGKKLPETVPNENCSEHVRNILADNIGFTMSAQRLMKIDVVYAGRQVKPVDFISMKA